MDGSHDHGGHNDQEIKAESEARARVDQLWRTVSATGNHNNSSQDRKVEPRSQRGGRMTLEPVELESAVLPVRPTPTRAASSSFRPDLWNELLISLNFSERAADHLDMGASGSSQLLMTSIVAASVEMEAVEEHRQAGSGSASRRSSSEFEGEQVSDEHEQGAHLRAAIAEHPLYPTMVLAHARILKVGASRALRVRLDGITQQFRRFEVAPEEDLMKLGLGSELDRFMRLYTELLTRFGEDLEAPYNQFMQFVDSATKDLEDICGHYVNTKPDEDNYEYDIAPGIDHATSEDSDEGELSLVDPIDVDDSIVVDPNASREELKKALMKKYGGGHIGGLQAEFQRVRKTAKLPSGSREILKDWFHRHSYWPYPSEMEKAYLQQLCSLDLKQINNWFINERKRHWTGEDKCVRT